MIQPDREKYKTNISLVLSANADDDYEDVNAYQKKLVPFSTANGMKFEYEDIGIGIGKILITLPNGKNLGPIKFTCNNEMITRIEGDNDTVILLQHVIKFHMLDENEKKITEKLIDISYYPNIKSIEELQIKKSEELLKLLEPNN